MNNMKVKVIVELDIPEIDEEEPYSDIEIQDLVADCYTHYVTMQHLIAATEWMASDIPWKDFHVEHHKMWAKISEKSKVTIERMLSDNEQKVVDEAVESCRVRDEINENHWGV